MTVRVRSPQLLLFVLFTFVAGGIATAAIVPAPTTAPDADGQRLIAHGSDERFWIGVVKPASGSRPDETTIYVRSAGETDWHQLTRLESRAVALNSRGTQLAVLTDSGAWYLVTDDSMVTGPPLRNGGSLLTFGNDGRSLWAVGKSNSSGPTTTSAPSTAPAATRPSANSLHLYWLGAGDWVQGIELPTQIPANNANVSFAFIDREPYLAWQSGPNQVDVARLAGGQTWEPVGSITAPGPITQYKLLSGAPSPTVWVAGPQEMATLHWLDHGKFLSQPTQLAKGIISERSAAAFAAGRVRILTTEDGKLTERAFEASDTAGPPTTMPIRLPTGPGADVLQWILAVAAAGLMSAMFASVRYRDEMRALAADPDRRPPLAPIHRRLIAGAIDASPLLIAAGVLIAMGVLGIRGIDTAASEPSMSPEKVSLYYSILILTGALYLSHTVFGELVAGRSLGKLIMGLRVVGLDGKPATPGAVVGRNAMRVVDIAFLFLPLSLILFSPLRQRAGDIAAGTLVVTDSPKRAGEIEGPPNVPSNTDKAGK